MPTYFIETEGFHMAGEIIMEFIISFTEYLNHYLKAKYCNHAFERKSINEISTLNGKPASLMFKPDCIY